MAADTPDWVTLGSGERVVWQGRPSLYLVRSRLGIATLVFLAGLAGVWFLPAEWTWVGWVVVLASGVAALYAYLGHWSVYYVVTSDKVYLKDGLVNFSVDTVRLDRIQNATLSQSVLQRLVSCGDIDIATAGEDSEPLVFESVPDPARVNGLLTDELPGERAADTQG